MIVDVTFEMYMRKVGTLILGEQIAYGLGDICVGAVWPWRLAANLAMAALLGRVADIAHWHGQCDAIWRTVRDPLGPYPEPGL